jgi:predicted nucleic acid-binding protein
VILLDTSAMYALASDQDPRHREALHLAETIATSGESLLLHSYVLCEAFSLLHRRRGIETALEVDRGAALHELILVDRRLHDRAVARLRDGAPSRLSLVDAVSFEVMRERGIACAFAFDPDFEKAGFRLYDGT